VGIRATLPELPYIFITATVTVVCIRSPLLKYFDGVASVSQIRVSATLLMLAEGNYKVRAEGAY
jgi:hypothetical protein